MTENKPIQFKQIQWVNYAKGITIILIVYKHALTGIQDAGIQLNYFLDQVNHGLMSFSMQLFMMLSGLFFYKSFQKRTYFSFLKNKISTILYPYVIWASIQLSVQIILSAYTNHQRSFSDFYFLLMQPRQLDQFWFLYALFIVVILHATLNYFLKVPKWFFLLVGIGMYFIAPLFESSDFLFLLLYFYIFYALGDFLADKLVNKNIIQKLGSLKFLILGTPIFIFLQWFWLSNSNLFNIGVFLIALLGCLYVINVSCVLDRYQILSGLIKIGKHSMHIFLMHILIIAALRILMIKFLGLTDANVLLMLGVVFGVYIPIFIYQLINKRFWWLFSLEQPKKQ
jgi:fucose 4-O-acetylase-like acetyltransferase